MPNALRRQTLHQEQELWYDQKLKRTESIFLERQLLSIFVEFLLTNSEPIWGPHHEKHKIRENFNHRKMTPPLGRKNAKSPIIVFRAEPAIFLIYMYIDIYINLHEEYDHQI